VASNGTDYFIAWEDNRSGSYDIYGARVQASDGLLLDGPPDTGGIAVSTAADDQRFSSVAFNGTDYFVAWRDSRNDGGCLCNRDIYGSRVAADGTVLDPAGIAVSTAVSDQYDPSVASNGTDYFVAWYDNRNGFWTDIYGARVASDGAVLDPTPTDIAVSTAASYQFLPSVASNGTDYFIAWEDNRSGSYDIYGARVRASDGLLLDGPPDTGGIAVSTAVDDQRFSSVAFNGTDFFVVWEDRRTLFLTSTDIYGARVTSAGTVFDPAGIAVSTATYEQEEPSVASNGTDYFVAWVDWRNDGGCLCNRDIYGTRVTAAGTVLDPASIAVSTAVDDQEYPSVASNGTDYFVAWQDDRSGTDYDIYGTRVASDGTVLDPAGVALSTAANNQYVPSVASNGTDYFVVWSDERNGPDSDIYGARVTSAGTVLDPAGIAVSTAADSQRSHSVASNGVDYFVAWQDGRSGADSDIYGARVTSAGTVLDPFGIAVSTAADEQWFLSVASNGTDYFVAWVDWRNWTTTGSDIYGARITSVGVVIDPAGIAISTASDWQQYPSVASNGTDYFVVWSARPVGAAH
jgi:hypothetical protein